MSDETPSAGSESTADDPDTRPDEFAELAERIGDSGSAGRAPASADEFEPTLDPPTAQSLPPEVPAPVAPEPPVPVQAPAPAVEAIAPTAEPPAPSTAPGPEPSTVPAVPEPSTMAIPEPRVQYAPEPPGPAPQSRAATLIAASRATPGRRALVAAGLTVVALVLLGGIGYAIYDRFYADPLADAVAGHCLGGLPLVEGVQETEVSNARIVHCTDPAAAYLVQGRLDNVTEEQARDPLICRGFRHATEIYKAVPAGGTGYVLCLSRVGE